MGGGQDLTPSPPLPRRAAERGNRPFAGFDPSALSSAGVRYRDARALRALGAPWVLRAGPSTLSSAGVHCAPSVSSAGVRCAPSVQAYGKPAASVGVMVAMPAASHWIVKSPLELVSSWPKSTQESSALSASVAPLSS